jgi:cytochrome d ubiquinol oxidase subunit II
MDPIAYWLPLVWAALLGVAVIMYVLLDGFDLGIGILFLTGADEEERDVMMNSIAPYWDGNETWLVLGGAGLLVAFPLAYSLIMPALYLPLIVMLLALVFRGVAFEFRFVSKPRHRWWDWSFALGSTVATFCQGLVLGGFLQGINVSGGQFAGGGFEWLRPFPVLCGARLGVADDENWRQDRRAGKISCRGCAPGDARLHRGRQRLDANRL